MRYSELKKCPGCGAPLTPPPNPTVAQLFTCKFCQTQVSVEPDLPAPPVMPFAPPVAPFGQPVGQFQPPAFAPTIHVRHAAPIFFVLPVVIALGAIIPAVLFGIRGSLGGFSSPLKPKNFPLTCGLNENIEIDGKTSDLTQTLVVASHNCKLKLKNCRLKGPKIIVAEHNAEIEIEGSTMEAAGTVIDAGYNAKVRINNSTLQSGSTAIEANSNPKISLSGHSSVKGKDRGMNLGANAELTIEGSSVEGGSQGVAADSNAKVRLSDGAVLKGAMHGLIAQHNPEVSVATNSRIESQGTAVEGGVNSSLTVRNAALQGKTAWDLGTNARVHLGAAKISGTRKQGTNGTVDEQ